MGVSARAADLEELAKALSPVSTLTRIGERARFTVSTVSLVGTALTALGLVSLDRVRASAWSERLVLGSAAVAAAAVLLALGYLVVRMRRVNRQNLADVEQWLDGEVRRIWLVVWASRLLLAAVVLAVAGAVSALAASSATAGVTVSLAQGDRLGATVTATVSGSEPGQRYRVTLSSADRPTPRVLLAAQMVSDGSGKASLSASVTDLRGARAVQVTVYDEERLVASADAALP